jgi:hypothetical protein
MIRVLRAGIDFALPSPPLGTRLNLVWAHIVTYVICYNGLKYIIQLIRYHTLETRVIRAKL